MARKAYFWNNIQNNGYDYRVVNGNLYLTPESVAQVAYDAGFRGEALLTIVALAGRESGYSPVVHGTEAAQSRVSGDRGLWQINYVHDETLASLGIISDTSAAGKRELFDPLTNARAAFALSSNGTNFAPWNAAAGGYNANGDPFYGTNLFKAADAIRSAGLGEEIASWNGQRQPSIYPPLQTPTSYPTGQTTYGILEEALPQETDFMTILQTLRQVGLGNTEGLQTFTQARMNAADARPLNYSQPEPDTAPAEDNTIDLANVLTPEGQQTATGQPGYRDPSVSSGTSIRQVEGPGTESVLEPDQPLAPIDAPFTVPTTTQPPMSEEDQERTAAIQEAVERIASNLQPEYAACLLDSGECDGLTAAEKATLNKVRSNPNSDLLNELEPMVKGGWQSAIGRYSYGDVPGQQSNPLAAIESELQAVDEVTGYVSPTSDNTTIRQIEGGYDIELPDWLTNTAGPNVDAIPFGVKSPDLSFEPEPTGTSQDVVIDDPAFWQGVYTKDFQLGSAASTDDSTDTGMQTYVPYDWEAAAQELYPQYWAIIKNNPEIAQLLRDSLGPPAWSDAKFKAKLYETNWWKSTSASVRQWDTASQLDPATYQAKVEAQATAITQIALDKGIKLSDETLTELATNSLRMGWTNQMTLNAIGMAAVEAGTTGMTQLTEGYYGQQMRQYASNYGVSLADTTFNSYINKIAVGEENLNSFQDYVMTIGKSLYPTLSDQFDKGLTFDDVTGGYKQIAANILERDTSSIDMMDPMFVQAVTYQPDTATGEQRMMNMAEWGNYLRNNESLGYEYTTEARSRAYATADKIANMFGRV